LRPLLLATRSEGKLRELRPLFAARSIDVVDLRDIGLAESAIEETLETHATFEDNALAKARYFHSVSRRATVADDSGLVVPALDGRPGVLSKRWSGRTDLTGQALDDENNRLLLRSLEKAHDRSAYYVCAAAYVGSDREIVCRGEVHGTILDAARGDGGFGYDPYFVSTELGRTFGEVSADEKARVSHRARAFLALIARMEQLRVERLGDASV
jgi:XTP/dITP diphosphohydrolase